MYVFDDALDKIMENMFQGKNIMMMNWFWKDKSKAVMMRVNAINTFFLSNISAFDL